MRQQFNKHGRQCFIREPKKQEVMELLARRYKRELINRGIITDPSIRSARYKFTWVYGSLSGVVYADNRSLARSLIKQELGIRKKNRLPIGVEITRETHEEGESDGDSTGSFEEDSECDNKRSETCTVV